MPMSREKVESRKLYRLVLLVFVLHFYPACCVAKADYKLWLDAQRAKTYRARKKRAKIEAKKLKAAERKAEKLAKQLALEQQRQARRDKQAPAHRGAIAGWGSTQDLSDADAKRFSRRYVAAFREARINRIKTQTLFDQHNPTPIQITTG